MYRVPDSIVIRRLKRKFRPEMFRELARETGLVERKGDLDPTALFFSLAVAFIVDEDRSIQALFEHYLETVDDIDLRYGSYYEWFTPELVAFLRRVLDDAIEDLAERHDRFEGRLDRFRDVLIFDQTVIALYRSAQDVYAGYRDEDAAAKLHVTESLSSRLPIEHSVTSARTHERHELSIDWDDIAEKLLLFDLAFFDYSLMARIDAHGAWFVTRLRSDANPDILEELRVWRGNSIALEGESLRDVINNLERDVIDVGVEVSVSDPPGSRESATWRFRVVGIWNEETQEYHLYITNLPASEYDAADIAKLYEARWEVELLFKELKSVYQLDEIQTGNETIIEALILIAAVSLVISRVIYNLLCELDSKQRDIDDDSESSSEPSPESRIPLRRCVKVFSRHAFLIHFYLMRDLGYDPPDLDALLLKLSQAPNPERSRLREDAQHGAFHRELA